MDYKNKNIIISINKEKEKFPSLFFTINISCVIIFT